MNVTIHPGPDADALHGSRGKVASYPLFRRTWKLEKAREKKAKKKVKKAKKVRKAAEKQEVEKKAEDVKKEEKK